MIQRRKNSQKKGAEKVRMLRFANNDRPHGTQLESNRSWLKKTTKLRNTTLFPSSDEVANMMETLFHGRAKLEIFNPENYKDNGFNRYTHTTDVSGSSCLETQAHFLFDNQPFIHQA